jgi:hypothetical protein
MTIIDTTPVKTIADLVAALNEFPGESHFEVVFKPSDGPILRGAIDVFAAVHQTMRPDSGTIVEIVVTEL